MFTIIPYTIPLRMKDIIPPITIFLLSFLLHFLHPKIGVRITPNPQDIILNIPQNLVQHNNYGA